VSFGWLALRWIENLLGILGTSMSHDAESVIEVSRLRANFGIAAGIILSGLHRLF
jgi:hypothetical protein